MDWTHFLIDFLAAFYGGDAVSASFQTCLSEHLKDDFYKKTEINLRGVDGKKIYLSSPVGTSEKISAGQISSLKCAIDVYHFAFPVKIAWESQSGKIYSPKDSVPSCEELNFWFEEIDAKAIKTQFHERPKMPFDLKQFSFQTEIDFFYQDGLFLVVDLISYKNNEGIIVESKLAQFVDDWNAKTEAGNFSNGLIHNFRTEEKVENKIVFYIDMGSCSSQGYQEILKVLDTTKNVSSVKITSFR